MGAAAVENGVLKHVSPSQIVSFMSCPRRWWYEKVKRVPVPQTGAQSKGVEIHKQLENYLLLGTPPTNPHAASALYLLPDPKTNTLLVEVNMENPTLSISGVDVHGRPDLVFTSSSSPDIINVMDFKSRSRLSYLKSSEDLAKDVQMLSYAAWSATKWPESKTYSLQHVYISTTSKKSVAVPAEVSREEVEAFQKSLAPLVDQMKQTAGQIVESNVVRSYDRDGDENAHCRAWGGCPFLQRCGKTWQERLFMGVAPNQ